MIEYEETECSCADCVSMCENFPCWPTPEEARLLIKQGYTDELMCVVYYSNDDKTLFILCPRIKSIDSRFPKELRWAGLPEGGCTFLTEEGLCAIHNETVDGQRIKPLEGRIVDHNRHIDPHDEIAHLWDTEEAQKLSQEWINNKL